MTRADQVIQDLPWKWNVQGTIFVIGGLGYMFDAWDVTLPGFVIPLLAKSAWHLSRAELGLFGTIGLIGMAIGACFWGTMADIVGRRRSFMYTLLIYSVFSLLSAVSPSYAWLLVFRFLTGFGLGGCIPVDYSVVAEFMPRRARGAALTAMDAWWPVGATLNGLIATAMLPLNNWRWLMLFMVLPALLVFWVRTSIPESPLFLIRKGRAGEARKVVQDLIDRTGARVGEWALPEPQAGASHGWAEFFTQFADIWRWNWKVTGAIWATYVTILALYFGVVTWLPAVLAANGFGMYRAYLISTSVTAIGFVGVLFAAWLTEITGRKWTYAISAVISGVAMVLFAAQIHVPGAARLWLLVFGFVVEVAISIIYCYAPELYPTLLRGTGFGWASTASRVIAGLIPVIFGAWLWPVFGLTNTFVVLLVLVLLASVWLAATAPETKGKALDEVGTAPSPPSSLASR